MVHGSRSVNKLYVALDEEFVSPDQFTNVYEQAVRILRRGEQGS